MKTEQEMLVEAQKKRFQQIMEYTNFGAKYNTLDEAGEDENMPQDAPADNAAPDMGGMPADGGQPAPDMGGMPADNAAPDMGGNAPMDNGMGGGVDQNAQQQTPPGFNPQEQPAGDEGGDITANDFEGGVSPEDDVVDISDLTDAQEETEDEVKEVSDKFDNVMKSIGKFEELLRANNEKIEGLQAEFEKRNPTQIEKLSMQTAKSGPFNVTPEEYWKDKEETSNYRTEDDDNGREQEQYVITQHDIDTANDWRSISKTLDESDDSIFHPTMENTMRI